MKTTTTKYIFLVVALLAVACGQQKQSSSTLREGSNDPETPVALAEVESLPGKPQALAFRIVDTDGQMINVLSKVSPGSPKLSVSGWKKQDLSDKLVVILDRQDPCMSSAAGWTCSYASADGKYKVTIRYSTAVEAYKTTAATWGGVVASEVDIFPAANINTSGSSCDGFDPTSCGWPF